jgi:hypothetical protein
MKKRKKPIGSGKVQLYGEPTKVVSTRIPISKESDFKEYVKTILTGWWVKK